MPVRRGTQQVRLWRRSPAGILTPFAGPGDVVSGASLFVSPARAYSAAFAAGGTAIMDLVDQAGANPITVNILSTGFVDKTAITNWVSAHSVTTIKVTKLYDQSGNGLHPVQATLATMPALTLNAINGLPALTFTGTEFLVTASAISSTTEPYTFSHVSKRTGNTSAFTIVIGTGNGSTSAETGFANSANNLYIYNGHSIPTASATDSAFHAVQANFDDFSATSDLYVDGSATATTLGGSTVINEVIHIGANRTGAGSPTGLVMEAGIWPLDFSVSSRQSLVNTNQHGTSGYNF